MKKIVLVFIIFIVHLFALDKANFPNKDMNVKIYGLFINNSSDKKNIEYKNFLRQLNLNCYYMNRFNGHNKTSDNSVQYIESMSNIKKVYGNFNNKNSNKFLDTFHTVATLNTKEKLLSSISDSELKKNTLSIGIEFIPDEKNLKLNVFRFYHQDSKHENLAEYLSMSFPKSIKKKNKRFYEKIIDYIILSHFQNFNTKKRDIVIPVTLLGNKMYKYKINFYSNSVKNQKYFSEETKEYNINFLNKLKLTHMEVDDDGDNALLSKQDASTYCSFYSMKLPDLSFISQVNLKSFSEDGLYTLKNPLLKIYQPENKDTYTFFCTDTSVKQSSFDTIKQSVLDSKEQPKIFTTDQYIDLTTIKYETK